MNSELVAQGSDGDPLDDGQLTLGGDAVDVLRCHRGVVDDNPGGLRRRTAGRRADVVDRCGCQPGDGRNIVEESEQARAHRVSVIALQVTDFHRRRRDECISTASGALTVTRLTVI